MSKLDIKSTLSLFMVAIITLLLVACSSSSSSSIDGASAKGTNGSTLYLKLITSSNAMTRNITTGSSTTLEATVVDKDGKAIPGLIVTFSTDLGTISPSISTGLTDNSGNAIVTLETGTDIGAGLAKAKVDVDGETLEVTFGYSVTGTGSTASNTNSNTNTTSPVVTTDNTKLTSSSLTGAIEFISASPNYIALRNTGGTGLSEFSKLTFKLVGTDGLPMSKKDVTFSLNTNIGGLALDPLKATSDNQGLVSTEVQAGTMPTVIRVTASSDMTDENGNTKTIFAMSDSLVVSTGIPDQNSFTVGPEIFNPEAWNINGTTVKVTARLGDHYNNMVPDGTTVYFTTEGGTIEPSCETVKGACTVNWVSSNPKPADHRITILATAIGSEGFVDTNSDGLYSLADGEPFNDSNGNGIYDEPFTDSNGNGVFDEPFIDNNPTNGKYDLGEIFTDYNNDGIHEGDKNNIAGETVFIDSKNGNGLYDGAGTNSAGETYTDANSDGQFSGPGFPDLGEPYVDANENGKYDVGEVYLDYNHDGTFNSTGDGKMNSPLCIPGNNCSDNKTIYIRQSFVMIMSGSAAYITPVDPADGTTPITSVDVTGGSKSILVYIVDSAGQIMPAGTTISVSTTAGQVSGATNVTVPSSTGVTASRATDSQAGFYPGDWYYINASDDDPTTNKDGAITITVKTPSGIISTYSINIHS